MYKNPLWIRPREAFKWCNPIGYARPNILAEVQKKSHIFSINCPIDIIIFLPKEEFFRPMIYAYCLQVNRFQCNPDAKTAVDYVRDLTMHGIELQYQNSRQNSIFKHPSDPSQWERFKDIHSEIESIENEYVDSVESLNIDTKIVRVDEIDQSQKFEPIITNDIDDWPARNESHNFKKLKDICP